MNLTEKQLNQLPMYYDELKLGDKVMPIYEESIPFTSGMYYDVIKIERCEYVEQDVACIGCPTKGIAIQVSCDKAYEGQSFTCHCQLKNIYGNLLKAREVIL